MKSQRFRKWPGFVFILSAPLLLLIYLAVTRRHGIEAILAPGSLSPGHATLQCNDCHVEAWRGGRKVLDQDPRRGAAMDQACIRCHDGLDGTAETRPRAVLSWKGNLPPVVGGHHEGRHSRALACGDCHTEHDGKPIRLRATDAQCVHCHGNLPSEVFQRRITSFTADHPPPGRWRRGGLRDEGQLRFNHQVHLNLLCRDMDDATEALQRLFALQCAFCHQADPAGRYMPPIRYEKHCAACHPLDVPLPGVRPLRFERLPHVEPALVRETLLNRLSRMALEHPEVLKPAHEAGRPMPGKPVPRPEAPRGPREWVQQQLADMERLLYDEVGGCRSCHIEQDPASRAHGLPRYERTNLAARWFPHAEFSHARHDAMRCRDCHPSATSRQTSDVLLPRIEKCRQCHNDRKTPGGARVDCVECHRYHGPVGRANVVEGGVRRLQSTQRLE